MSREEHPADGRCRHWQPGTAISKTSEFWLLLNPWLQARVEEVSDGVLFRRHSPRGRGAKSTLCTSAVTERVVPFSPAHGEGPAASSVTVNEAQLWIIPMQRWVFVPEGGCARSLSFLTGSQSIFLRESIV